MILYFTLRWLRKRQQLTGTRYSRLDDPDLLIEPDLEEARGVNFDVDVPSGLGNMKLRRTAASSSPHSAAAGADNDDDDDELLRWADRNIPGSGRL